MDDASSCWKIRKDWMLSVFAFLCLAITAFYFVLNHPEYVAYAKAKDISHLMALGRETENTLGQIIVQKQSPIIDPDSFVGGKLLRQSDLLDYFDISDIGKIHFYNEDLELLLTFTPELLRDNNGKINAVTWRCYGQARSEQDVPETCRGN